MPDPPFPPKSRRPTPDGAARTVCPSGRGYAELRCRTNYSFLDGASHPDELVERAAELGLTALAITDQNSLAGVVRAHVAAKPLGLKLLIGAEITPSDAGPVLLWAMNREGYGRLSRLLTVGRRRAPKGECHLTLADIADHAAGLLAGVLLQPQQLDAQRAELPQWRDLFGDRCYAVAELHRGPQDEWTLSQMQAAAGSARLPLVAANGVHYHVPERRYLQDVLRAIRRGCTVAELGEHRFANGERSLLSAVEMRARFHTAPDLVDRTQELADRCTFSLDELQYDYPEELCPADETLDSYLTKLTWAGAVGRYPQGIPDKVRSLLEHELRLIAKLNYAAYFLTVWDLVRFARSRDILCQGRGSAANSAVCFCLGVTSVDPDRIDVLFERFISEERNEAPDIDIDFEHERREEVLQYIYEKYGRERAGMTAEVITYRPRSAVRDVGKALGLSLDRVDALAKSVDHVDGSEQLAARFRETGFDPTSRIGRQLLHLVREILGFPRHLSQHVGGMVLTHRPLCELVPIENASMPGRTVLQWDKDDLDALGILKVDCLALGMLSAIRRAFDLIRRQTGEELTLAAIPAEDPAVYDMIQQADTVGVFQIESRGQMSMLPRLKPREFYDLVIEVAIVRPGPIQGDMVHPYLRRRSGEEAVDFPSDAVRDVLKKTLGVPLFQEQAMKLAVVAAGFTPGEADQLRRAMGAWRKTGVIEKFHQKLIAGMLANGYTPEFAERLYNQIRGFGEYGFPESHAASFALLVYASAWIKRYHPAVFLAALLNSQPMGFYAPAQLVSDARKHGVSVRPVDIQRSEWDSTLEHDNAGPPAVRLGFRQLSGIGQEVVERIVAARRSGPFGSVAEVLHRTGLRAGTLTRLARADVFASLGLSRREAVWQAMALRDAAPLFDAVDEEPRVALPTMSPQHQVVADYQTAGLSLRAHPLQFLRSELRELGIVTAADLTMLESDRRYKVAGLVLLRQRPSTAKGITFVTLEDETGTANLIVHQATWQRFHQIARRAGALIARGILQRQDGNMHVIVDRLDDLTTAVAEIGTRSRDFH
ncbi:MAG: error-prone DNA polymerase [Planctomycetaceae bacterium]|nr:error-prone DNA polymerase [Planctomycetaceae bacterium]